jgi:hypothetical protein
VNCGVQMSHAPLSAFGVVIAAECEQGALMLRCAKTGRIL